MSVVRKYTRTFEKYETLFHLVLIDVSLLFGIYVFEDTLIDYTTDLMGSMTIVNPNGECYKVEFGRIKEDEEFILVEFDVYYETPNGFEKLSR
jgi:hypothetical protein